MLPAPRPFTKVQLADEKFMAEYHKKIDREARNIMALTIFLVAFIVIGGIWAMYMRQQIHHDLWEPCLEVSHNHHYGFH